MFYYSCEKCKLKYCKLPSYCIACNVALMNSQFFLQNKNTTNLHINDENYLTFSTIIREFNNKNMKFFDTYPPFKALLSLYKDVDISMNDSNDAPVQNGNHHKPQNNLSNINILCYIKQISKQVSKILYSNVTEDLNNVLKNNPQCDGCNVLLSVQVFENPSSIFCCISCLYVLCK